MRIVGAARLRLAVGAEPAVGRALVAKDGAAVAVGKAVNDVRARDKAVGVDWRGRVARLGHLVERHARIQVARRRRRRLVAPRQTHDATLPEERFGVGRRGATALAVGGVQSKVAVERAGRRRVLGERVDRQRLRGRLAGWSCSIRHSLLLTCAVACGTAARERAGKQPDPGRGKCAARKQGDGVHRRLLRRRHGEDSVSEAGSRQCPVLQGREHAIGVEANYITLTKRNRRPELQECPYPVTGRDATRASALIGCKMCRAANACLLAV